MVNIQRIRARTTELEFHLQAMQPHIVLAQETWLDSSTEEFRLEGYITVSRRDRATIANRDGIITLARAGFNKLVWMEKSAFEERSWHFLHLDPEIILLGNWYRPGSSVHDGFLHLQKEFAKFVSQITGVIITGDLNIHHTRWLHYSNGNTQQGADLKVICDNFGWQQLVHNPTRNDPS